VLAVEVVVMRDIASRPRSRIELQELAIKVPNELLRPGEEGRSAVAPLPRDHSKHISDRPFLDNNAAVHAGLAEFHFRVEEDPALRRMAPEANGDRLSTAIAECKVRSACGRNPKRSCANGTLQHLATDPSDRISVNAQGGRLATSPT
jgi:hypothetical protein